MADEPTQDQPNPDPAATEEPGSTEEPTQPDPAAEVEKWKALARKHEQRAKENADKARRLDEIEEASKTELEKAQARAEAAEKAMQEASLKALRAEIAAAKGVPVNLLSGTTEDELNAAADALLAFKGTTPKAPSKDGQGNVGDPIKGTGQWTRTDLERAKNEGRYADIDDAREKGLLADVLAGKS